MNSHYNRNYTKEQATVILQKIHDCLRENRYTIAQNETVRKTSTLLTNTTLQIKNNGRYFYKSHLKIIVIR